jgi:hypothetical protein
MLNRSVLNRPKASLKMVVGFLIRVAVISKMFKNSQTSYFQYLCKYSGMHSKSIFPRADIKHPPSPIFVACVICEIQASAFWSLRGSPNTRCVNLMYLWNQLGICPPSHIQSMASKHHLWYIQGYSKRSINFQKFILQKLDAKSMSCVRVERKSLKVLILIIWSGASLRLWLLLPVTCCDECGKSWIIDLTSAASHVGLT